MALPRDLQQLVVRYLPADRFITIARLLPEEWWQIRYQVPRNFFHVPPLFPLEACWQVAAYDGDVNYENSAFLTPGCCLVQSVNVADEIFIDVIMSNKGVNYAFAGSEIYAVSAALTQTSGVCLSWLLAEEIVPHSYEEMALLVWQVASGLRVSAKALRILRLLALHDFSVTSYMVLFQGFWRGYFTALDSTLAKTKAYGNLHAEQIVMFCLGYLVAGGQNYRFLLSNVADGVIADSIAYLNYSRLHQQPEINDMTLLMNMNTQEIAKMPRRGQREFPIPLLFTAFTIAEYQKRARALQFLLPLVYRNSPALQNYLLWLRFILAPTADYTTTEIAVLQRQWKLLLIFARHDYLTPAMLDNYLPIFYQNTGAFYLADPLTELRRLLRAQARTFQVMTGTMIRRIYPTVAWRQQLRPLLFDHRAGFNVTTSFRTLEELLTLAEQAPVEVLVENRMIFECILLHVGKFYTTSTNELHCKYGKVIFVRRIVTAYEQDIWQRMGATIKLTGLYDNHMTVSFYLAA